MAGCSDASQSVGRGICPHHKSNRGPKKPGVAAHRLLVIDATWRKTAWPANPLSSPGTTAPAIPRPNTPIPAPRMMSRLSVQTMISPIARPPSCRRGVEVSVLFAALSSQDGEEPVFTLIQGDWSRGGEGLLRPCIEIRAALKGGRQDSRQRQPRRLDFADN